MSNVITVSMYQVVGSTFCVALNDGQKVYDRIESELKHGRSVRLSFENVSALTAAFLNAAIGQLYGTFDPVTIRSTVKIVDIPDSDIELLNAVIETAKLYFKNRDNREALDQAIRDELGDDDCEE